MSYNAVFVMKSKLWIRSCTQNFRNTVVCPVNPPRYVSPSTESKVSKMLKLYGFVFCLFCFVLFIILYNNVNGASTTSPWCQKYKRLQTLESNNHIAEFAVHKYKGSTSVYSLVTLTWRKTKRVPKEVKHLPLSNLAQRYWKRHIWHSLSVLGKKDGDVW